MLAEIKQELLTVTGGRATFKLQEYAKYLGMDIEATRHAIKAGALPGSVVKRPDRDRYIIPVLSVALWIARKGEKG